MVYVIKAGGQKEEFDKKKIMRTVSRAGVDNKTAREIANKIASVVHDGETTHNIYRMILRELNKLETKAPFVYRFREAIAGLGPMEFEKYVKRILEFYGFKCELDKIIKGKLVEHEVDIVAKKNGKTILVECKHHINPHRFTPLETVLTVWARMDDINQNKSGKYHFNSSWVVTNTKFSDHALKYAKGKGMYYMGWDVGGDYSLDKIISKNHLYPLTLLKIDDATIHKLMDSGIYTIRDLLTAKTMPLPEAKAVDIIEQAHKLANHE